MVNVLFSSNEYKSTSRPDKDRLGTVAFCCTETSILVSVGSVVLLLICFAEQILSNKIK